jgi:glyoxylase-like metal-dependent hydrolase (beta-lactamase superfamily II)
MGVSTLKCENGGMAGSPLIVETRAAEPFFKNGYVVGCPETRDGIVIDPGDEVEELLAAVAERRLQIRYILLTHAHLDHITGVGRAREALGAPVGLHEADDFLYRAVVQQGRAFGFEVVEQPPVDFFYDVGAPLRFGRVEVWIQHTPGHSPGGVCLAVASATGASRTLFVGDTLFAGSIGRTDLPGGDMGTLMRSIREVLLEYPDETVVLSGHGPATTIGRERASNPFLV